MTFRISNIYKSLVRHVVDTVTIIENKGVSTDIRYHDWDSRGDESELPSSDLIGLAGWTFREERGLWVINAGITISTVNDDNLFREIALIDEVHDLWGEQCVVPLRDDAGVELSQLVVDEFELMPSGQSEKRNYRPIGLTLLRTSA